ncbi:small nucleolar ribonucleoprotein MPP10 [Octopus vulgaris]|uniref:U3 small nucleolar ribonucleoprotein protein MPP10 n=1 Tax=Octopus vulgaris TaxID=6645 RepID=A0AA36BRU4_OCTVU|nr:small nucleolar ribonucleoprotein MPP10 [Octopus vulgaris]
MAGDEYLGKTLNVLNVISRSPENFLDVHKKNAECLKETTKKLYDLTFQKLPVKRAVSELIVDSFENEQVWEELELYNGAVISEFITDLSHLIAGKERISFKTSKSLLDKNDDSDVDDESNDDDDDEVSDDAEEKGVEEETLAENSEDKEGDGDDDEVEEDDDDDDDEIDKELVKIKSNLKKYEQLSGTNKHLDSDIGSDSEGDPNDLATEFQEDVSDVEDSKDSEPNQQDEDKPKKKKKTKSSVVDDNFFKLSEMETFLKQQDALEARKMKPGDTSENEDNDIDVFQDIGSDEEENVKDLKFKDFFRGPMETLNQKKVKFADIDDNDDQNEDENKSEEGEDISEIVGGQANKSTFELRQERLKNKIAKLEKASVSESPWQLKGEINATARPENSLLEEHVQFDSTLKLPPDITEESTKTIEDLIIQRIKDQAWDDVERKSKVPVAPFEYKKAVVLDQEKSKLSLGEIYEKEFLQQQQPETNDKEKGEDPLHEEIDKMMNSLFLKLDALSNFHFTPKLPISDVKIVSNLPSITMEEVAPVSVSELQLAAPKELLEPLQTTLKGKSEFSAADKKRQRKMKKNLYKLKQKEKEKQQKATEGLNPNSEKTAKAMALRKLEKQSKGSKRITILKTKDKKKVNSSAAFFSQLQNEVRSNDISSRHSAKKQKVSHKSAISLKL